jgi:hypothetical protein
MQDPAQFDVFVRAGLAQFGIEVDDVDLQIIRIAEQTYGPQRDALLAADLSDVAREAVLDPARPPEDAGEGNGSRT